MALTILLTGFGPFPGAPFNPTGALVSQLVRRPHPAFADVRRVGHVFATSYAAVDNELPQLIDREQPDALIMFGLAMRSRTVRIEMQARNAVTRAIADAAGQRPTALSIVHDGPGFRALPAPAHRLLAAARASGVPAALSRDAGRYLCNYLCWRASELAAKAGSLRLAAFVHVPPVRPGGARRPPMTFDALVGAGEAIVLAATANVRARR